MNDYASDANRLTLDVSTRRVEAKASTGSIDVPARVLEDKRSCVVNFQSCWSVFC